MFAFHARTFLPIVVIEHKDAKGLILISNLLCNINLFSSAHVNLSSSGSVRLPVKEQAKNNISATIN